MSPRAATLFALTPKAFWVWGRVLLTAGLVFGLLLVLLIAWTGSEILALLFTAMLIALPAAVYLFKRPALNLYVALAAFVLITGYSEGFQIQEALYGLYFLSVLGYWFASRVFFYRDALVQDREDGVLLFFLLYAAASAVWAVLFGAKIGTIIGEALVLVMLTFYFPVKAACARSPRAAKIVLGIIFWFALFVSLRNLLEYRAALSSATRLYQIATGRVALNEVLLMMPALSMLALMLYAQRWRSRLLLLGGFLIVFAGLILTQSRGYWAAFLFGALALFIFIDHRRKGRILLLMGGGLALVFLLGALLFEGFLTIIVGGVIERFASLGTAITSDVSLVNRFYESLAVWDHIKVNPILGYGPGTEYHYFNITVDATRDWAFVHNGFVGLWYKFGLVGLVAMLYFWGKSIWNGVRLFRMQQAPPLLRLVGLSAAVCLIGEALVANTSNPFLISDATLMIALFGALASGSLAYARRLPPREEA